MVYCVIAWACDSVQMAYRQVARTETVQGELFNLVACYGPSALPASVSYSSCLANTRSFSKPLQKTPPEAVLGPRVPHFCLFSTNTAAHNAAINLTSLQPPRTKHSMCLPHPSPSTVHVLTLPVVWFGFEPSHAEIVLRAPGKEENKQQTHNTGHLGTGPGCGEQQQQKK